MLAVPLITPGAISQKRGYGTCLVLPTPAIPPPYVLFVVYLWLSVSYKNQSDVWLHLLPLHQIFDRDTVF